MIWLVWLLWNTDWCFGLWSASAYMLSELIFVNLFATFFFLPLVKVGAFREIYMNWVCIMHNIEIKSLESCSQCRPGSSCGIDLFLNRGDCVWEWVTMIWFYEYVVNMVGFEKVQWKKTETLTVYSSNSQTKTFYYSTSFTVWRFNLIKEVKILLYFHCIVLMLSYLSITFTAQFP